MTSEGGQGVVSTASLGAFSILSTSSTLDSNRSSWTLAELGGLGGLGESSRAKVGCPVSTSEAISNKRDWPFKLQNNQLCTLLSVVPLKTLLVLLRSAGVWPHNQVF